MPSAGAPAVLLSEHAASPTIPLGKARIPVQRSSHRGRGLLLCACSSVLALGVTCIAAESALAQPAPARTPPSVTPPAVLSQVDAVYPPSAVESGQEGVVVLKVSISAGGVVTGTTVIESMGPDFDEAATRAVVQWTFTPATRDGRPIASIIRVPIRFDLGAPAPPPAAVTAPVSPRAASAAQPGLAPPAKESPPATEDSPGRAKPEPMEVTIAGRSIPPSRGASDVHVHVGALGTVPRKNATELLKLAPGVFLSKEGGEGHAERVYLRGFDAREGQDVEISVNGVPINESGNLHGNGFADLHFIIPELVRSLRVLEGPFDPRQGNYAVAGSADYELGLDKRGLTAKYTFGSFNTHRLLVLWGPPSENAHTFGGAELSTTDGFGANRDAKRATAMGQYEGQLGKAASFRVAAAAYANEYHSAGLLRESDVASGRKDFFDTYDFAQGGGGTRFQLSGDLEARAGGMVLYQSLFAVYRSMRLRENLTGFLLDTQTPIQHPHGQRGDLFDLDMTEITFGARGWAKARATVLGQRQELELGYFARGDHVSAVRQRIDASANVPYKTDADLESKLADIGLYGDANLRATRWLAVRGGMRADVFAFDVLDACAVKSVSRPSEHDPPGDQSCLDQQRFGGYREPTQRSSTAAIKLMPRGSLIVGPIQHFTFSLSAGVGVRSIDPSYITQDVDTPFASITAYEGGVSYTRTIHDIEIAARSILFATHVDRDLAFSETEGRNILGGGTTRTGWVGSVRATGDFFDESANVTLVRSAFDDTHLLVPYAPDVVVRSDTALFHDIPLSLLGSRPRATLSAGITYIGRRALSHGQRSEPIFTLDASTSVSWKGLEVGFVVENLLGSRYRLAEFNYVSDFGSAPAPTLVPARHFAAGAPRSMYVTLAATFGGS